MSSAKNILFSNKKLDYPPKHAKLEIEIRIFNKINLRLDNTFFERKKQVLKVFIIPQSIIVRFILFIQGHFNYCMNTPVSFSFINSI